ncbi:hypothetical protein BDW60DRAFT_207925 [Aspergillus nidulans var. acristatus]
MDYGYPTPDSTLGMDLAAFFQNMPGAASFDLTPDLALISSEANHGVPGRESNSPISVLDQLPLAGQTVQLIDEFFGPASTPLEWAILATAARAHRDATVQSSRHAFASSRGFACTKPSSSRGITRSVMLLAQAYSLACLNGLGGLDEPDPNVPATMHLSPIEMEECRGTLWALFVLDRQINYLMGRHFVTDDVRWCVSYPLDDASLQSQHGLRHDSEPERCYSSDVAALAWEKPNIAIGTALPRLVSKASVMIGRIATYKGINPMPSNTHSAQKRRPTSTSSSLPSPASGCLYHLVSTTSPKFHRDAERRSPGSDQYPTERENFTCNYKSVNKVVTALRALSGLATDAVLDPMLAYFLLLVLSVLLLQWRRSQQQEFRLGLGLVLRLLERMADKQEGMAKIYKEIIKQELGRDLDVQDGWG